MFLFLPPPDLGVSKLPPLPERPAIVQTFDLSKATLPKIPGPEVSVAAPREGMSYFRAKLSEFANSLQDPELKTLYTDPRLRDREKLGVLNHVAPAERYDFVVALLSSSNRSSEVENFLRSTIDNCARGLSVSEKAKLIKAWLPLAMLPHAAKNEPSSVAIISALLWSSQDVGELSQLVKLSGESALWATRDVGIRTFVARAELLPEIRKVDFPKPLSQNASEREVQEHLAGTKAALEQVIKICERERRWQEMGAVREYTSAAEATLREIGRATNAASSEEANRLALKGRLEVRFGVRFVAGVGPHASPEERQAPREPWKASELLVVEEAFSKLPEGTLLWTPLLYSVEKVPSLPDRMVGLRRDDGAVLISQAAIDNESLSKIYGGKNSLEAVLVHEIGHALQIAWGSGSLKFDDRGKGSFGSGEILLGFDDFVQLSGWRVYARDRYRDGSSKNHLILDGGEIEIGKPVIFAGELLTFYYDRDWNELTAYSSSARFSNSGYGRENPWEDWAECFAEYLLLPERLVKDSPRKFWYMELEFQRYANNPGMLKEARSALVQELNGARHTPAPPLMREFDY